MHESINSIQNNKNCIKEIGNFFYQTLVFNISNLKPLTVEFLEGIPNPLYKYRDWNNEFNKKILTDCEVYLSAAEQFNDPYDSSIPFRYNSGDLTKDNILKKMWLIGKQKWPTMSDTQLRQLYEERINSGVFDNGQYWKDIYQDTLKEINELYGILSLTSKNDNILMWSHYANSHHGFCIGFDKRELFMSVRGSLSPIIYSLDLPQLGLFEPSPNGLIRILTTKSIDWKYEDEYRIIKSNASKKTIKLPSKAITEIILGYKMPMKHKTDIVEIAKEKYPHAKIFQSEMNLNEFKMDIIPISK